MVALAIAEAFVLHAPINWRLRLQKIGDAAGADYHKG